MRVVLVNPPRIMPVRADFPPLGLAFIGAVAQKIGHQVTILDASDWSWKDLRVRIRDSSPDILGVTCWTIERGQSWQVLRFARDVCPKVKLVAGGPHASAFPEHVFAKTPVDYVVIGEGEHTFRELLNALDCNGDISTVSGLAYRLDGKIVRTATRQFEENLDSFPMLLHEQFDYSKYKGLHDTSRRSAAVMTSRGCPFHCIYCSSSAYWGRKLRKRSIPSVMAEVEYLYHQKGIRAVLFFDDNLLVDAKRCVDLSKALCERKLDLVWAAEGSVKVDLETLEWMKKAGCYRIDFGVESGSPEILRNIGKSFSVEDSRRAFELCRKVGINPNGYLIVGSPGETMHTVDETVQLMREIQPHKQLLINRPGLWIFPDTELYKMSLEKGVIREEDWLNSDETFMYTGEYTKQGLQELADEFNRQFPRDKGKDAIRLWIDRFRRLLTEPRSLLASVKQKLSKK
jgi:anaerobic magnesium-protoporphyrin IX monomethyl ester cyclase